MNTNLFIDAISCLDSTLIEEHIKARKKLKVGRLMKKRFGVFKKALIASCLSLLCISTFLVDTLFRHIDSGNVVSTSATGDFFLSLLVSAVCVAILGGVIWMIGRKIIIKKCENDSCDL